MTDHAKLSKYMKAIADALKGKTIHEATKFNAPFSSKNNPGAEAGPSTAKSFDVPWSKGFLEETVLDYTFYKKFSHEIPGSTDTSWKIHANESIEWNAAEDEDFDVEDEGDFEDQPTEEPAPAYEGKGKGKKWDDYI